MQHTLVQLPYEINALEPFMSQETLEYHHGKHLQTYVDNLNKLIAGTEYEHMPLEEIVQKSEGGLFNNAGQVWNHTVFFLGFTPQSTKKPGEKTLELLERDFGSFEAFQEQFTASAVGNFGSGWTWLVMDEAEKLSIINTSNADNPLTKGKNYKTLLACDVWEHSYYIDTRNSRPKYLENFWNIVDWERVESYL